jgi:hypothetical protein
VYLCVVAYKRCLGSHSVYLRCFFRDHSACMLTRITSTSIVIAYLHILLHTIGGPWDSSCPATCSNHSTREKKHQVQSEQTVSYGVYLFRRGEERNRESPLEAEMTFIWGEIRRQKKEWRTELSHQTLFK